MRKESAGFFSSCGYPVPYRHLLKFQGVAFMKGSFSAVVALLAAVFLPTVAHPQGFGTISKKKVSLHRKLPASAHLPGNAVQIKVTARDTKNNDIAVHVSD